MNGREGLKCRVSVQLLKKEMVVVKVKVVVVDENISSFFSLFKCKSRCASKLPFSCPLLYYTVTLTFIAKRAAAR